jgi:ATP-dependent RNA circularization protein (DNA/RNA ligase family)
VSESDCSQVRAEDELKVDDFIKFPHTPHLAWLGSGPLRGDKLLSPEARDRFLSQEITIEEKVDGDNVGISIGPNGSLRLQNRGHFIDPGAHRQFGPLLGWLSQNEERIHEALSGSVILFGEWCFAVHSVHYNRLPAFLLGFDIYDIEQKGFWSSDRRNALLKRIDMAPVPRVARGRFDFEALTEMLEQPSALGAEHPEGIYLRWEDDGWLKQRAKLVRGEFVQTIKSHWSRRAMKKNRLVSLDARSGVRGSAD